MKHYINQATTTAAAYIERGSPPESRWHVLTALNEIRARAGLKERRIPAVSEGVGSGADENDGWRAVWLVRDLGASLPWAGWQDVKVEPPEHLEPHLSVRRYIPAPPPQAVQGELLSAAREVVKADEECRLAAIAGSDVGYAVLTPDFQERGKAAGLRFCAALEELRKLVEPGPAPDCQPEKGGEG